MRVAVGVGVGARLLHTMVSWWPAALALRIASRASSMPVPW